TTEIIVTVNGIDHTAMITGNTWTVNVPGSVFADGAGNVDAKATFTDAAGNESSADAVPAPYTLDMPAQLSDANLDVEVTGSTIKAGASLTFNTATLPTLKVVGDDVIWSGTGATADPLIAKDGNDNLVLTISI